MDVTLPPSLQSITNNKITFGDVNASFSYDLPNENVPIHIDKLSQSNQLKYNLIFIGPFLCFTKSPIINSSSSISLKILSTINPSFIIFIPNFMIKNSTRLSLSSKSPVKLQNDFSVTLQTNVHLFSTLPAPLTQSTENSNFQKLNVNSYSYYIGEIVITFKSSDLLNNFISSFSSSAFNFQSAIKNCPERELCKMGNVNCIGLINKNFTDEWRNSRVYINENFKVTKSKTCNLVLVHLMDVYSIQLHGVIITNNNDSNNGEKNEAIACLLDIPVSPSTTVLMFNQFQAESSNSDIKKKSNSESSSSSSNFAFFDQFEAKLIDRFKKKTDLSCIFAISDIESGIEAVFCCEKASDASSWVAVIYAWILKAEAARQRSPSPLQSPTSSPRRKSDFSIVHKRLKFEFTSSSSDSSQSDEELVTPKKPIKFAQQQNKRIIPNRFIVNNRPNNIRKTPQKVMIKINISSDSDDDDDYDYYSDEDYDSNNSINSSKSVEKIESNSENKIKLNNAPNIRNCHSEFDINFNRKNKNNSNNNSNFVMNKIVNHYRIKNNANAKQKENDKIENVTKASDNNDDGDSNFILNKLNNYYKGKNETSNPTENEESQSKNEKQDLMNSNSDENNANDNSSTANSNSINFSDKESVSNVTENIQNRQNGDIESIKPSKFLDDLKQKEETNLKANSHDEQNISKQQSSSSESTTNQNSSKQIISPTAKQNKANESIYSPYKQIIAEQTINTPVKSLDFNSSLNTPVKSIDFNSTLNTPIKSIDFNSTLNTPIKSIDFNSSLNIPAKSIDFNSSIKSVNFNSSLTSSSRKRKIIKKKAHSPNKQSEIDSSLIKNEDTLNEQQINGEPTSIFPDGFDLSFHSFHNSKSVKNPEEIQQTFDLLFPYVDSKSCEEENNEQEDEFRIDDNESIENKLLQARKLIDSIPCSSPSSSLKMLSKPTIVENYIHKSNVNISIKQLIDSFTDIRNSMIENEEEENDDGENYFNSFEKCDERSMEEVISSSLQKLQNSRFNISDYVKTSDFVSFDFDQLINCTTMKKPIVEEYAYAIQQIVSLANNEHLSIVRRIGVSINEFINKYAKHGNKLNSITITESSESLRLCFLISALFLNGLKGFKSFGLENEFLDALKALVVHVSSLNEIYELVSTEKTILTQISKFVILLLNSQSFIFILESILDQESWISDFYSATSYLKDEETLKQIIICHSVVQNMNFDINENTNIIVNVSHEDKINFVFRPAYSFLEIDSISSIQNKEIIKNDIVDFFLKELINTSNGKGWQFLCLLADSNHVKLNCEVKLFRESILNAKKNVAASEYDDKRIRAVLSDGLKYGLLHIWFIIMFTNQELSQQFFTCDSFFVDLYRANHILDAFADMISDNLL